MLLLSCPSLLLSFFFLSFYTPDWLVDRNIVSGKWQDRVKDVRGKINNALKTLPKEKQFTDITEGVGEQERERKREQKRREGKEREQKRREKKQREQNRIETENRTNGIE